MIAFAMAKTSYSGERVRETGEVIVTVPGAEIADAVIGCGSMTGRNTDKVSKFGIEFASVTKTDKKTASLSGISCMM